MLELVLLPFKVLLFLLLLPFRILGFVVFFPPEVAGFSPVPGHLGTGHSGRRVDAASRVGCIAVSSYRRVL